jgi:hypothetical protein
MTDRNNPGLSDEVLDRALGKLQPPAPSELLRARIGHAMATDTDSDAAREAAPSISNHQSALSAGLIARFAATLLIGAAIGLGAWFPVLGPITGQSPVAFIPAPGAQADDTGIVLTLVGDESAGMAAVALVRADWSVALTTGGNDIEFAVERDGAAEGVSALEEIPLY